MIEAPHEVKDLLSEGTTPGRSYNQIIINFCEDIESDIMYLPDEINADYVGAKAGDISNILEIINPEMTENISFFKRLYAALEAWETELRTKQNGGEQVS